MWGWKCVLVYVYGKQSWVLWSYMDQEHNSDQDDTSQPTGESQLSAASLVSPFVSVKPNTVHSNDTAAKLHPIQNNDTPVCV